MNGGGVSHLESVTTKTTPTGSNSMVGNTNSSIGGGSSRVHFRSQSGCCICGTKSSSSRFVISQRYAEHFGGCFGAIATPRQGDLCNACVLCVKRWLKASKKPGWFAQVLDSKKGPGPKHMKEITKRARRREARLSAAVCTTATTTTSSASCSTGKPRQVTAAITGTTVLRRSSPGYSTTTRANLPASVVAVAVGTLNTRENHARHRQQTAGQLKMWSESVCWHSLDPTASVSACVNSHEAWDRLDVAPHCPLSYSNTGSARWSNGDKHFDVNCHVTSARDLSCDNSSEKTKVLRMTCTRAATTRRLEAKGTAATTCRALSSSTPNRGNRDHVNQVPAHLGASSSFSTCNSETSDYGSASSLSASSSTSSALSASLPRSIACCCCCCCCCFTRHRSASISKTQQAISRGSAGVVASSTLFTTTCKCCPGGGVSSTVTCTSRDDCESSYKRLRCDSGNGSSGRDKPSTTTTRLTGSGNNCPSVKPVHTGPPNCTILTNTGYPTRHGAVTIRKSCCCCCCRCRGNADVVNTNGSQTSEFRLPPPPMTSACANNGRRGSLACEDARTNAAAPAAVPPGATNHAASNHSPQVTASQFSPIVPAPNATAATEIGAQSTRRYNRRVVLPPVRMTDNPELDALYREIMDLNSQAVNFDSREIHMAVQHKLRQRSRITANSTSGGGSLSGQATTSSSVSSAEGSSNLEQKQQKQIGAHPVCSNNNANILPMSQAATRLDPMPAPSRHIAKRHHPRL